MLVCMRVCFLASVLFPCTNIWASPSVDSGLFDLRLKPPDELLQRDSQNRISRKPSTSLAVENNLQRGPASVHIKGADSKKPSGSLNRAPPPALGTMADFAGQFLEHVAPDAQSATNALQEFSAKAESANDASVNYDEAYVNTLTGFPCRNMNSVFCQSTTTTSTSTYPPGLIQLRKNARREIEKEQLAQHIADVMQRRADLSHNSAPPLKAGLDINAVQITPLPATPGDTVDFPNNHRRRQRNNSTKFRAQSKKVFSKRRLQMLPAVLNTANLRVGQVENAVLGAASVATPRLAPGYPSYYYPHRQAAVAPVFQPISAAAQGSYYRQHNLAQARVALTNAMSNNAQYRNDARQKLFDASHQAAVKALENNEAVLVGTMRADGSQNSHSGTPHMVAQTASSNAEGEAPAAAVKSQETTNEKLASDAAILKEQMHQQRQIAEQLKYLGAQQGVSGQSAVTDAPRLSPQTTYIAGSGLPYSPMYPPRVLPYQAPPLLGLRRQIDVDRINDVSSSLVQYGIENDWSVFKALSDNIANVAEASAGFAASASQSNTNRVPT